uniref:Orn/DAP/Arg decarboxylase 2 N-terminal domain-containing protein n=1 Tax=Lepisosteus oculatus TaxID=7918 RepID=W5LYT6_LEPOC
RMLLRISVQDCSSVVPLNEKFGAPLWESRCLLEIARELGVRVVGVSFHVGSGCQDPQAFSLAMADARSIFTLGQQLGHSMTLLDIGGGFPGTDHTGVTLEEIYNNPEPSTDLLAPIPQNMKSLGKEPGRYYVTSAFTLAANVTGKKEVSPSPESARGERRMMYYLNDGLYGSLSCLVHDLVQRVEPQPSAPWAGRALHPSTVWGPTCDSLDLLGEGWVLPELELGAWLLFRDRGAYSLSCASRFCGFDLPSILHIISPACW